MILSIVPSSLVLGAYCIMTHVKIIPLCSFFNKWSVFQQVIPSYWYKVTYINRKVFLYDIVNFPPALPYMY